MNRTRALLAVVFAVLTATLIAACGGGGGNDENPQQVLNETFSNGKSIQSGTFDLDFKVEANGGDNAGSLEAKLGGPFQGGQSGQFPQFKFDVSLKAEGAQTLSGSGGLTSTGDKAYVNFQGTDYEVPQNLFDEFTTTYAQLQSQNSTQSQGGLLQSLGINPATWLTNLKNEGTEDVEGTKTIHISGQADVPKLVADLKTIAQKAGGAANVDPAQLDQLNGTVQSADLDVFTGESDKQLRKLEASLDLKPPAGTPGAPDSLTVDFSITFGDLNQPQTIQAPANPQSLTTLLQRIGIDPSQIGNSLRGSLGTGGALPQSGGSTTAPSASATQAYLQCIQQAQGRDALQQCAGLLGQ